MQFSDRLGRAPDAKSSPGSGRGTLTCDPLLQICWDVKACPGAQWTEQVVGNAREVLDTFPFLLLMDQLVWESQVGKGLTQQGQTYSGEKAKAVAWKGQVHWGGTAFAVLTADFTSLLSLRTLSPPTSFLKQQEAAFLAGRSSLEPVPWRWKWQKQQDGERGWG